MPTLWCGNSRIMIYTHLAPTSGRWVVPCIDAYFTIYHLTEMGGLTFSLVPLWSPLPIHHTHVVLIVTSSPFPTLALNTVSIAVITFCTSSSIDLFHIWLVWGDSSQMCGSTWRIHIYSITPNASMTATTPMITSSASPTQMSSYMNLGCFADSSLCILSGSLRTFSSMNSPSVCAAYCKFYPYFGLEHCL